MFGIRAKLPVSEERRLWVNDGFARFSKWIGRSRMTEAKVYLPVADDFPDEYVGDESSARRMMERIAAAMGLDTGEIDLEVYPDEIEGLRGDLPLPGIHGTENEGSPQHAAGLYFGATEHEPRTIIALNGSQLKNPMALVATLSHELSHQILLGRKLVARDAEDMEPLTDLLTVFLGFGVFNANSAVQFEQHQKDRTQGWSVSGLGYLSEQTYGYALARFAWERQEEKPVWAKYLAVNIRHYFDSSAKWLKENEPR
jgi:hypothetical protein